MKIYHNPPHIYVDKQIYFITAHTYGGENYIKTDLHKSILRDKIKINIEKFGFNLFCWVILGNHYHLMMEVQQGKDLKNFVNMVHGSSSYAINRLDNKAGRKIWYSYWDTCVR